MEYIYIDVLIVTNFYVNYFLIKSTAKITHTALRTRNCVLTALFGSVFALTVLLPKSYFLLSLIIKIFGAFIIVKFAFSQRGLRKNLKLSAVFFGINLIFAGVILLFWQITKSKIILVNNMSMYFDLSILLLIVATIVSYIIVSLISIIFDRSFNKNLSYKVKIKLGNDNFVFDGVSDTGNSLIDSFTGRPIIVCTNDKLGQILNITELENGSIEKYLTTMQRVKGLRLVPYSTIGNSGVIPAFLPDSVIIESEKNDFKQVDAFIGVSNNSLRKDSAIFNPRLLI